MSKIENTFEWKKGKGGSTPCPPQIDDTDPFRFFEMEVIDGRDTILGFKEKYKLVDFDPLYIPGETKEGKKVWLSIGCFSYCDNIKSINDWSTNSTSDCYKGCENLTEIRGGKNISVVGQEIPNLKRVISQKDGSILFSGLPSLETIDFGMNKTDGIVIRNCGNVYIYNVIELKNSEIYIEGISGFFELTLANGGSREEWYMENCKNLQFVLDGIHLTDSNNFDFYEAFDKSTITTIYLKNWKVGSLPNFCGYIRNIVCLDETSWRTFKNQEHSGFYTIINGQGVS
ncbi:MAG: hypothetical protein ACRC4M_01230 [Mycoplasma sp.]